MKHHRREMFFAPTGPSRVGQRHAVTAGQTAPTPCPSPHFAVGTTPSDSLDAPAWDRTDRRRGGARTVAKSSADPRNGRAGDPVRPAERRRLDPARREAPDEGQDRPYECGIVPEQEPVERFPVKFYWSH